MCSPAFGNSNGISSALYFSIFFVSVELRSTNSLAALVVSNFKYIYMNH